ncbi:MAG: TonB-dependent receptor [Xanthomonadales bacterium]|nr:TonB-dependent receptor [Xanthomonadales bacterium]
MKKSLLRIAPLALMVAGLPGLTGPVAAQQSGQPEASSEVIEEIIVVASRREERAIDVPVSLSVFDATSAVQTGITDINAMADFVPNLQAQDGGAPGLGNLVIRGIYVGGAPTVGTYIDDVPYGGVVGSFAASLALDASLYDLDRIEVVRGPQGTLYGASSVGGVVRYITRPPSLEEVEGYISADYADIDNGESATLIRGRVSVPLAEDRFAVAVSGYSDSNDGFIDNGITGEADIDSFDYSGGRLAARWAVTDDFELNANVFQHEADFDSASYETFDPTSGQPIFGRYTTEFAAPRELELDIYSLTADVNLSFGTFTSVTSDQTGDIENLSDVTPVLGPLLPGSQISLSSGSEIDRFTQEFRLTSNSEGSVEWIVGAYYTKQESEEFQITIEDPPVVNLINLQTSQEYEELALFGNMTYAFSDAWDVTLGLRYSDNENAIQQSFTGALSSPLLDNLNTVTDDSVTTYLLNTRYRFSDSLNFYGRAASGYRPGGANLVVDIGGQLFGTPSYSPDDLWSYEAGIKGRLADGRLSYDVGVYVIDWSDAQIGFVNPVTGLGETGNAEGDVDASGLEASLSGELFPNFLVTASLAIADAEIEDDEPNLGGLAGESLPGNPESTASIAADYLFTLGSADVSVGATWRHTGDYNSNFSQAVTGNYSNPSYSHFDIRAGVRFDKVSINLYGTNITDKFAYQTVFPVAPVFAYGVPLRPRTYGINLRYDF